MTASKKRIVPHLEMTDVYHGPKRGGTQLTDSSGTSSNWSGVVEFSGAKSYNKSTSFYSVAADYVVPVAEQAFGACTGNWDYSSSWVGIDGDGSGDVLQAGSESDAFCEGSTTSTFYSAWYEWYPYGEVRISNLRVTAGDAGQGQRADALRAIRREGRSHQRAQRMADEMAGVDAERVEETRKRGGIVSRNRRFHRQGRRAGVARRVPRDDAQVLRQSAKLIVEGARGRADAVQQDERYSRARLAVGDDGSAKRGPAVRDGRGHAASKVTVSGWPEPTAMVKVASTTPSLRK